MTANLPIQSALLDLEWILSSPSILKPSIDNVPAQQAVDKHSNDWLNIESINTKHFADHLARNNSHFLGPYFESLWQYYLHSHPRFKLIASNLQIHDKGKTVGEFDFIVYDNQLAQYVHQELALKFYLGWQNESKSLWIGPQEVDRLDKKVDRLLNHQISLSEHPAAKKKLNELGIDKISPQIVMKGCLFQPLYQPAVDTPDYVSDQTLMEHWLPRSKLKGLLLDPEYQNAYWKVLEKKDWLRPYRCPIEETKDLMNDDALLSFVAQSQNDEYPRPILLSYLKQDANGLIEGGKLFIVSDDWPRLTKTSPPL